MDCEWMNPDGPEVQDAVAVEAAEAAAEDRLRLDRDSLMNPTIRQLFARKSVRAFEPRPVAPPIRALLLEAAVQAPTAGNQMLYTILDITDPALKTELAELCDHQPFIAQAPLVLIFLADGRRWLGLYRAAGCEPRPQGPGDALLAMADALAAAQNVVVAAQSLGLGSCYIGDILENCERVRAALRLPEDVIPAAMLVIGWPTPQQLARPKPARFDWQAVICENGYQEPTEAALRQMYEDRAERTRRARPPEPAGAGSASGASGSADAGGSSGAGSPVVGSSPMVGNSPAVGSSPAVASSPAESAGPRPDDGCIRFAAHLQAFCARKYESDFAREMNRSAAVYLRPFLKGWS